MNNTPWDILGLGSVAVDDLIYVDQYPLPDSKIAVQGKIRQGGGMTGTALVAASRLGVKTAYCGVLGYDELSRYTIDELERENVDCTSVIRKPDARPVSSTIIVERDTGRRTILYSASEVIDLPLEIITNNLISKCKMLFVDNFGIHANLRAVDYAKANGIPVIADMDAQAFPELTELVEKVDHLIVGLSAGQLITNLSDPEKIISSLAKSGRVSSVLTVGENGCWFSERGGRANHVPAFKVQTVDTTGCGDVFHGAYAASIICGKSVTDAIRISMAAAAIKAARPGGREGIPDPVKIKDFLNENNQG